MNTELTKEAKSEFEKDFLKFRTIQFLEKL